MGIRSHLLAGLAFAGLALLSIGRAAEPGAMELHLRKRTETGEKTGRFHATIEKQTWDAARTAVIVCDMWDLHHCLNATRRGAELTPRMNQVLQEARRRGATIIHAPSSCMETYANHPARKRAAQMPPAARLPDEIGKWCYQIPSEEQGEYPIDQTDGGEDDDLEEHRQWAEKLAAMGRNPKAPWKSQTDGLEIRDEDLISDSGVEIWNALEHRQIENVILLGVHTNMCVLGRPFGLRQMVKNGKRVALMRDMTDTMYNPEREPKVSHFTGTDLIVEHIEKWVCPTITSDQLLGGKPFRFSKDKRPHVVFLMSEPEYETGTTLPEFARHHLAKDFRVSLVFGDEKDGNRLPGLESLRQADVAIVSLRRRALSAEQMELLREFIENGKPIVGVRTANHALSLRGEAPPEGHKVWEEFDADVIGGHYTGHHGAGPRVAVSVAKGAESHAILKGVDVARLHGYGSLYQVNPLADSATPLLIGTIPDKPSEPIAWVNRNRFGGRVFYTSLAHRDDFQQESFNRLLRNAVLWAIER